MLLDPQDADQDYIEDCQVCCRPIEFHVSESTDGSLVARVNNEID